MDFAKRLSCLMEEAGLSNLKLAKTMGVSDRLIGAWRKGENGPTLISASHIADFFGVSLDYLSGRSDDRRGSTKKEPALGVSENGLEFLRYFEQLTEREQLLLIGEARGLLLASGDRKEDNTSKAFPVSSGVKAM